MTDKTPEEVALALTRYTLVRKDELERLQRLMAAADTQPLFAPSDRITDGYGNQREPRTPADYVEAYRDRLARALLAKEPTGETDQ